MKTRELCVCAILTAVLTGGKLAIAAIPNVEIVTLLFIVYSLVLGWRRTMIICLAFVAIECFIWGFGIWVPLYFIYWPIMITLVCLLPKFELRVVTAIIIGIILTAFFGVLSTFLEICLLGGIGGMFWQYFYSRYVTGVSFFVTHILSNSIILSFMLPPLYKLFSKYVKFSQQELKEELLFSEIKVNKK